MNREELGNYYKRNHTEFLGEDGHEKLLVGLKKYISDNAETTVGIDVGCNVGGYLHHIRDICKNSKILAFEPNPANITALESIPDICLYKCCLSDRSYTASLYNWHGDPRDARLAGLRSGGAEICKVQVFRLDEILESLNEDFSIKFIKIDTEGNDTNIIKGMGKWIKKTKYMIFECSDCLDDIRGPGIKNPMKDIVDYLDANDLDTYRIGTKKLIKVNGDYWNDIYETFKFFSNCFAIQKTDDLIKKLIDENFDYRYGLAKKYFL